MKIISWNVNGIRACLDKGLEQAVLNMQADYFCLQESKAFPDQVQLPASFAHLASTWACAEKKGYSGCVTFSPHSEIKMQNKLGIELYDREGRANIIFEKKFTLVNLYFPNGAASDERHWFKMKFLDDILVYLKDLEEKHGPLVICGDYNIAHTEIDIHDPVSNKDSSGFKPEERAWMSKFLEAGFVDSFRHMHPAKKDEYSWWSYRMRSRERNKGWRIDYICVSKSLKDKIKCAKIHQGITGSDHCPIEIELAL